jgi:hypothetical protein
MRARGLARPVDPPDADATVLCRLGVGDDLDQLAGGCFTIGVRGANFIGEFRLPHAAIKATRSPGCKSFAEPEREQARKRDVPV